MTFPEPPVPIEGQNLRADLVRRNSDVILHLYPHRSVPDFERLVAEVVESHFGTTEGFCLDRVPELRSWALLMYRVADKPLFRPEFYVEQFLELLDAVLSEV